MVFSIINKNTKNIYIRLRIDQWNLIFEWKIKRKERYWGNIREKLIRKNNREFSNK